MALHTSYWTEGVELGFDSNSMIDFPATGSVLANSSVSQWKRFLRGKTSDGPTQLAWKGCSWCYFSCCIPSTPTSNQWQHNKMAMIIVIFIALITKLITVLLISCLFPFATAVRVLVDPDMLKCSFLLFSRFPFNETSSGLKNPKLLALAIRYLDLFTQILTSSAAVGNDICWTCTFV